MLWPIKVQWFTMWKSSVTLHKLCYHCVVNIQTCPNYFDKLISATSVHTQILDYMLMNINEVIGWGWKTCNNALFAVLLNIAHCNASGEWLEAQDKSSSYVSITAHRELCFRGKRSAAEDIIKQDTLSFVGLGDVITFIFIRSSCAI